MSTLSPARKAWPLVPGLTLLHRGKVRDTYALPGFPQLLLIVTTDGISVYDFVLNWLVAGKGEVLTALSHFWFTFLEQYGILTHLVAAGSGIDSFLPVTLRGDPRLQKRSMVVRKLTMLRDSETGRPIELITRSYLAGSAKGEYARSHTIAGMTMPEGLQPGDKLPFMIFNPTTKAEEGHDEPLPRERVEREHRVPVAIFKRARELSGLHAESRGLLEVDGKGEGGFDNDDVFRIGDEFATFDSSRFWLTSEWERSRALSVRSEPPAFDKQMVRDEASVLGFNVLDAKDPDHIARVWAWTGSPSLEQRTFARMCELMSRLTGKSLADYQREDMGIAA